MMRVKFGLFSMSGDFSAVMATALRADRAGFYSFSPNDHFFSPFGSPEAPQLECFTILSAIAARTNRIRLAPAVVAASFRPPPLLAKIATTLDIVSGGRLILGVGAGWLPGEYHAHGYPFPSTPERLEQLAEALQVVKAMWTQEEPTFKGRYFAIEKAYNQPRPIQRPHPPIMLGGSGTRLLQIAAAYADLVNLIPPTRNGKDFPNDPVATLRFDTARLKDRIKRLRGFAEAAGRDPEEIELSGLALLGLSRNPEDPALGHLARSLGFPDLSTAQKSPVALLGSPDQVCDELRERIEDTGMAYFILAPTTPETLDLFVDEVMPQFAPSGSGASTNRQPSLRDPARS